jgi:hypothetical protein
MNSRELHSLLSQVVHRSTRFLGVFAADKAPAWASLAPSSCYILNTDPATEDGEHWLAVFKPDTGPCELFDSYALPLDRYHDVPALANAPADLVLTPRPLQHPMSTVCGHYTVYYLYHRSRNQSLTKIVNRLESLPMRDSFVRHYVRWLRTHRAPRTHRFAPSCLQGCCSLFLAKRLRTS